MLRAALAFLIVVAISHAAPVTVCPPDMAHDALRVTASCPGIGADVFAKPGSTWLVAFNDNTGLPGDDYDFNDLNFRVEFGNGSATLTYLGSLGWWHNTLYFGSTPLFYNYVSHAGDTVSISLATLGLPTTFKLSSSGFFGHQWLSTGTTSAYVVCERGCGDPIEVSHAPEPGSLAMAGLGALAILIGSLRRRK